MTSQPSELDEIEARLRDRRCTAFDRDWGACGRCENCLIVQAADTIRQLREQVREAKADEFTRATSLGDKVIQNGYIGNVAGFSVHVTTNLAAVSGVVNLMAFTRFLAPVQPLPFDEAATRGELIFDQIRPAHERDQLARRRREVDRVDRDLRRRLWHVVSTAVAVSSPLLLTAGGHQFEHLGSIERSVVDADLVDAAGEPAAVSTRVRVAADATRTADRR